MNLCVQSAPTYKKMTLTARMSLKTTIFLNRHNRCKCNVGCITNFVRLIITREAPCINNKYDQLITLCCGNKREGKT
jgi:hypothetical protein